MSNLSNVTQLHTNHEAGSPNLFFDMRSSRVLLNSEHLAGFKVTAEQLPILNGIALSDLRLTREHMQEPHWHPNAGELVYNLSGEVTVAVLNPLNSRLQTYRVEPGQVVYLPMGWYHWIACESEEARVLMITNNAAPLTAESADVFRFTPSELFPYNPRVKGASLQTFLPPQADPPTDIHGKMPPESEALQAPDASIQDEGRERIKLHVLPSTPPSLEPDAAAFPPAKQFSSPAKKASSIRHNNTLTEPMVTGPSEPSIWHPAVPGLQVRIGSTIRHT